MNIEESFLQELYQIYHVRFVQLMKLLKRSLIFLFEYHKENIAMNLMTPSLFYQYGSILKILDRIQPSFHYQKEIPKIIYDSLKFFVAKLNELTRTFPINFDLITECLNLLTVFFLFYYLFIKSNFQ